MNLVLSLLILGGSSVAVWAGITDPEGGVLAGIGNVMSGTPNVKHVSTSSAEWKANIVGAAGGAAAFDAGKGFLPGGTAHAQGAPSPGTGTDVTPPAHQPDHDKGNIGSGGSTWGLRPQPAKATREVANRFGIGTIYGLSVRNIAGTSTLSDHAFGLASDFMGGKQNLADYVVANAGRLHVNYVIYNHRIWSAQRGWHAYTGENPHTDHVHVSFLA